MTLSPEAHAASLVEALPYIQKFRGCTFVIKYGGAAMEDEERVARLLRDVVFLEAVGINPVLVHGGGKAITSKMNDAGLQARFVNGLRVTDEQTIEIVSSTLDGQINPKIVETINSFGGKARGVSGRNVFVAKRMTPQPDENGNPVDIGFVGEAERMNITEVEEILSWEVVPVISPIGAEEDGTTLNINADIAAAALAASLQATKLIFVSDVPGILKNPADPSTLIPAVSVPEIPGLIESKVLAGGMIPKVQSAAAALKQGVEKVHMIGGHIPHGLLLEIFTTAGIGTEITPGN